jgi:2-oxo-4-hydroxy-4-carboxy-5-ureidoimidazoline decarboxylase
MTTEPKKSLDTLNRMDRQTFVETLGGVFEDSPWVAERAWDERPYPSVAGLHRAMTDVVRRARPDERVALLRAHPDLGGRLAREGALSPFSAAEQGRLELDRLSDAEVQRFDRLNAAYRARFGFPFIICVRNRTRQSVLEAFERRLGHPVAEEIDKALDEVFEIVRHRLADAVDAGGSGVSRG